MFCLSLFALALAQAGEPATISSPDVVVVSTVWPGMVAPETANRLEELIQDTLVKAGLRVQRADASSDRAEAQRCGANPSCYAALGTRSRAKLVVRIEPAEVARQVTLLVVAIADGSVIAQFSGSVSDSKFTVELPPRLEGLVTSAKAHVAALASVQAAPQPAVLPVPAVPVLTKSNGWPLSRTLGVVGLGIAVGAVGAGAVIFGTVGQVDKNADGYVFSEQAARVPGIQRQQAIGVTLMTGGGLLFASAMALLLASLNVESPALTLGVGPGAVVAEVRW